MVHIEDHTHPDPKQINAGIMYIVHVNASYKPANIYGGPTRSVSQLCEALAIASDDRVLHSSVLTTRANGESELSVPTGVPQLVDGVRVTYFDRITKDHSHLSLALLNQLQKEIKNHKQDGLIIHIHAWWNLVSVGAALIAYLNRVPYVLSPRGMITEYSFKTNNSLLKSLFHKIIGKKLLETANLHSTTEFEAKVFKQHVQPRSSYVIHNLVEFPERNPSTSEEEKNDTFRLLFLSRVDKKKGLELLFEAISTLSFAWTLTIAGTGDPTYVNALKQRAAELGITANIIWIGQVDNTFKFELIKESDVFCLTSYNENFANVVIESISQGTAVLVSDQVGLYEYVDANKLGIVCKMQSDDVVNKITQLHDDPTLLEDIKVQGPMIIQRDFDKKMLANKYIDMYNQILYSENT